MTNALKRKLKSLLPSSVLVFINTLRGLRPVELWGRLIRLLRPSQSSRRFWTEREIGNQTYIKGYWDSWGNPLRTSIAKTVANLNVESVAETGAHCGVNLYAISKAARYSTLSGADVSAYVVNEGKKLLAANMATPWNLDWRQQIDCRGATRAMMLCWRQVYFCALALARLSPL